VPHQFRALRDSGSPTIDLRRWGDEMGGIPQTSTGPTEGAGGFNPLKERNDDAAFRPGHALYQGTTSVVPIDAPNRTWALAPEGRINRLLPKMSQGLNGLF